MLLTVLAIIGGCTVWCAVGYGCSKLVILAVPDLITINHRKYVRIGTLAGGLMIIAVLAWGFLLAVAGKENRDDYKYL